MAACARGRIACARIVTLIQGHTRQRARAIAHPRLAGVDLCAPIAVIACRSVGLVRIAARTGRWIAYARDVALIERHTRERIGPRAHTHLTRIRLRTRIAVVACGPVDLVGIAA